MFTGKRLAIVAAAAMALCLASSAGFPLMAQTSAASTGADASAVAVMKSGVLALSEATISTSGKSSSSGSSSFYGLDSGVIAASGSRISLIDSTVRTTGLGANGVFAAGVGSSASI